MTDKIVTWQDTDVQKQALEIGQALEHMEYMDEIYHPHEHFTPHAGTPHVSPESGMQL